MDVKKIYIHPLPVRIWHWTNAVGFVLLILTGLQIRYRDLLGLVSFEASVRLHNYVGFALMGSYLLWLFFYLTSDKIKNYQMELQPDEVLHRRHQPGGLLRLRHLPRSANPHHASPYTKFNPMQKLTYDLIMLLVVPVQFLSGLLLWDVQRFSGAVALFGGVRTVDTVHVLFFIFFSAFLPVHAYLATLGHTPGAHFKAMFTGYEEEFGAREKDVNAMEDRIRVLVVDDEEVVRLGYRRVLSADGFRVMAAGNGSEALDMMGGDRFDVVLLDMRMPGMDGMEVLRAIKERWPRAKSWWSPGTPRIETAKEAVKLGAYDYLAKPVVPEAVIRATTGAWMQKRWAIQRGVRGRVKAGSAAGSERTIDATTGTRRRS